MCGEFILVFICIQLRNIQSIHLSWTTKIELMVTFCGVLGMGCYMTVGPCLLKKLTACMDLLHVGSVLGSVLNIVPHTSVEFHLDRQLINIFIKLTMDICVLLNAV